MMNTLPYWVVTLRTRSKQDWTNQINHI